MTRQTLDDALASPGSIVTLDLSGQRLETLPPEIGRLTKLQALHLERNDLTELPRELFGLRELRELTVADNALTRFVADVGSLPALRCLDLSRNPFVEPVDLGGLTMLEEVNLAALPCPANGWSALRALRVVDLSKCELETFPDLSQSAHLRELILSDNRVTSLPPWLFERVGLERLDLASCGLTELPDEVARLERLKSLCLNDNSLTNLPTMLFRRLSDLERLLVANNPLRRAPKEIGRLRRLRVLDLSATDLGSDPLEEIRGMFGLTALALDDNALGRFPDAVLDLDALDYLSLRRTGVQELPRRLSRLGRLRRLNLTGNSLSELPADLAAMPNLELCDLRANRLRTALTSVPSKCVVLLRDNPAFATEVEGQADQPVMVLDRRWSTDALERTIAGLPIPPVVHSVLLPARLQSLEHRFGVGPEPVQDVIRRAEQTFELLMSDVELARVLLDAGRGGFHPGAWFAQPTRATTALAALAHAFWSACVQAPRATRELLGALLLALGEKKLSRFALYDALTALPASGPPPRELTADAIIDRAIGWQRACSEERNFRTFFEEAVEYRALLEAIRSLQHGPPEQRARMLLLESRHLWSEEAADSRALEEAYLLAPSQPDVALESARVAWLNVAMEAPSSERRTALVEILRLIEDASAGPLVHPDLHASDFRDDLRARVGAALAES